MTFAHGKRLVAPESVYQQSYNCPERKRYGPLHATNKRGRYPAKKGGMHLLSTTRHDYKAPGPNAERAQLVRHEEEYKESDEQLQSVTSYRDDYPTRRGEKVKPIRPSTKMENPIGSLSSLTTNKQMYKEWPTRPREAAWGEPLIPPLFRGKFDGLTTLRQDFVEAKMPRPRTSYKRPEKVHALGGKFESLTTHKEFYERHEAPKETSVIYHRKRSQPVARPRAAQFNGTTTYQGQNQGIVNHGFPPPRPACPPHQPQLNLFPYKNDDDDDDDDDDEDHEDDFRTVHSESYRPYPAHKASRASRIVQTTFKYRNTPMDLATSHQTHFREAGGGGGGEKATQMRPPTQLKSFRDAAAGGESKPPPQTTNRTDFRAWDTLPRMRHGDLYERSYKPRRLPHDMTSMYGHDYGRVAKPLNAH